MRRSATTVLAALLAGASALAACSGGGHHALPPTGSGPASNGRHMITLVLTIPKKLPGSASAHRRTPKWISQNALGATLTLSTVTNSGTVGPVTYTVSLQPTGLDSPNATSTCQDESSGNVCTLSVPAPGIGNTTVSMTLYDKAPVQYAIVQEPTGVNAASALATGTIALTVTEGVPNVSLPLVLGGIVASVRAVDAGPLSIGSGSASSTSFVLQAYDASGAAIVATDGAFDATGNTATVTVTVPMGIWQQGVTIADATQHGSASTQIQYAAPGDVVAVAASGTLPQVVGVPLQVTLQPDGTALGSVYLPNTTTASAPTALESPSAAIRIAAIPIGSQYSSSAGGPAQGNGVLETDGANLIYAPLENNGSDYEGTKSECAAPGITHLAAGQNDAYYDLNNNGDWQIEQVTGAPQVVSSPPPAACSGVNLAQDLDQTNLGDPPGLLQYTGIVDDGTRWAATFDGNSYNTQNGIVLANDGSTDVGSGNYHGFGDYSSNRGLLSPVLLATGVGAVEANAEQLAFFNSSSLALDEGGSLSGPVSAVSDGTFIYVLGSNGSINQCSDVSNALCSQETSVSGASTDPQAMALGDDGNLWIATGCGLVSVNTATWSSVTYSVVGASCVLSNTQVAASGDGHVYLLAPGNGLWVYP